MAPYADRDGLPGNALDFYAVGQFYREFRQVEDEEVIACLEAAAPAQTHLTAETQREERSANTTAGPSRQMAVALAANALKQPPVEPGGARAPHFTGSGFLCALCVSAVQTQCAGPRTSYRKVLIRTGRDAGRTGR